MNEKTLAEYRDELNGIDEEIVRLYSRRVDTVEKIGEYKKAHGMAVLDRSREDEIFRRLKEQCGELRSGGDIYPDIEQLYRLILTLSKERQSK